MNMQNVLLRSNHALSCGLALSVLVLTSLVGCGGGGGSSQPAPTPTTPTPPPAPPPPPPATPMFDTTGMLTNFADNIIAKNYAALRDETSNFAAADGPLASLCSAIGSDTESAARDTARNRWREVTVAIQKTEMHVIGPALANGETLRQRILSYASGSISSCGIDQSAALVANEDPDFNINARSLNQRGYGAIEYLLFNDQLTHTCAPQVPATMEWNELEDTSKRKARCDLASLIAADVAEAAELLATRWGTYREEFIAEGNTGNTLQLVTDAIFAIDTLVKDGKLGIPLGIHDACSADSCPDQVESKYVRNSLANIHSNVTAWLEIFRGGPEGGEELGFDDLIEFEEFPEVSTRFLTNLNAVIAAIDVAHVPLYEEALQIDSNAEVTACTNAFVEPDMGEPDDGVHGCRVTGLLKRVTDDLKIDFVTIVNVTVPGSAQADND